LTPVFITADAEADLEGIADFIAEDNPVRALSFANELRQKALTIGSAPRAYPTRGKFGTGLRVAIYRPYLIVFREVHGTVEVLRFIHGARDIERLFGSD
jgi:toxin ParE1/3/4